MPLDVKASLLYQRHSEHRFVSEKKKSNFVQFNHLGSLQK